MPVMWHLYLTHLIHYQKLQALGALTGRVQGGTLAHVSLPHREGQLARKQVRLYVSKENKGCMPSTPQSNVYVVSTQGSWNNC